MDIVSHHRQRELNDVFLSPVVVMQSNLIHFLDVHALMRPVLSDVVSVSVVCSVTLSTAILGEMTKMPATNLTISGDLIR
jgi:hypothetical protein